MGKFGPETSESFLSSSNVFPGRLHLYNIDNGKTLTIHTNQGDSEILLVEDNVVYYRSSDRLYSVEIKPEGLGESKLLATDDLIRDVHWAFTKGQF